MQWLVHQLTDRMPTKSNNKSNLHRWLEWDLAVENVQDAQKDQTQRQHHSATLPPVGLAPTRCTIYHTVIILKRLKFINFYKFLTNFNVVINSTDRKEGCRVLTQYAAYAAIHCNMNHGLTIQTLLIWEQLKCVIYTARCRYCKVHYCYKVVCLSVHL